MRIAIFYFALFGMVGILLPYLPPYLRALGFDGKEIAAVGSLSPLLMIAVPPIWGFLADRTRSPVPALRIAALGSLVSFVPLIGVTAFPAVMGVMAVHGIFRAPLSSLADTAAVYEARRLGTDYARLRLWGSVGFVVTSFAFSAWLEAGGRAADVLPAAALFLAGLAAAAVALRRTPGAPPAPRLADAGRLARRPAFLLFLLAGMLHWAAMGPYNVLFAIHFEDLGLSATWIGAGLAAATVAEVAVMALFRRLHGRFALTPILLVTFVASAGRWAATGLASSGAVLAGVQILHGLSFGAFFVASVAYLEAESGEGLLATGRGLFSSLVFGAGGVLGNLLAGALYDLGGADLSFLAAAGLDLVAPLLLLASDRALAAERASPVEVR